MAPPRAAVPSTPMAGVAEVRNLLGSTSVPDHVIDSVLSETAALWMIGERAAVVAADLVLCHPPLGPTEVRAVVRPIAGQAAWRLTVVARDHRGLLADVAAVLAADGLTVTRARAMAWSAEGVAVISLTVADPTGDEAGPDWDALGTRLRAVAGERAAPPPVPFQPRPPVRVEVTSQESGRVLVRVRAPDRVGLLWAIASWLAAEGCDIEAIQLTGAEGTADDVVLVRGVVDSKALAARLSGRGLDERPGSPPLRALVAGTRRRLGIGRP